MTCPLCERAPRTHCYHEDDLVWVVDCSSCGTPMIVWKDHVDKLSPAENQHVCQVLLDLFGHFETDGIRRTYPDHWHAHVRGEEGQGFQQPDTQDNSQPARPKLTHRYFQQQTGRPPRQDDMERVRCEKAGQGGHWQCGWCYEHDRPRFECGCRAVQDNPTWIPGGIESELNSTANLEEGQHIRELLMKLSLVEQLWLTGATLDDVMDFVAAVSHLTPKWSEATIAPFADRLDHRKSGLGPQYIPRSAIIEAFDATPGLELRPSFRSHHRRPGPGSRGISMTDWRLVFDPSRFAHRHSGRSPRGWTPGGPPMSDVTQLEEWTGDVWKLLKKTGSWEWLVLRVLLWMPPLEATAVLARRSGRVFTVKRQAFIIDDDHDVMDYPIKLRRIRADAARYQLFQLVISLSEEYCPHDDDFHDLVYAKEDELGAQSIDTATTFASIAEWARFIDDKCGLQAVLEDFPPPVQGNPTEIPNMMLRDVMDRVRKNFPQVELYQKLLLIEQLWFEGATLDDVMDFVAGVEHLTPKWSEATIAPFLDLLDHRVRGLAPARIPRSAILAAFDATPGLELRDTYRTYVEQAGTTSPTDRRLIYDTRVYRPGQPLDLPFQNVTQVEEWQGDVWKYLREVGTWEWLILRVLLWMPPMEQWWPLNQEVIDIKNIKERRWRAEAARRQMFEFLFQVSKECQEYVPSDRQASFSDFTAKVVEVETRLGARASWESMTFAGLAEWIRFIQENCDLEQVMEPKENPKLLGRALADLRPALAAAAQKVVDEWEQDEEGMDEELGGGGVCDRVAMAMIDALHTHLEGIEATCGAPEGEAHEWVVVTDQKQAFIVDIHPSVYETGGGYSWRKVEGAQIRPEDVLIDSLDMDLVGEIFEDPW